MKRELDEIEAEMGTRPLLFWEQVALLNRTLGKERTMKWCTYSGNGCYRYPRQYASDCLDCPYFKECIPVEPERVPGISGYCTAPPTVPCTGKGPCDKYCQSCQYWHGCESAPSPGLLQRMGMVPWVEKPEWFVAVPVNTQLRTLDEALVHAAALAKGDDPGGLWQGRVFRWQDGLR